MIVNVQLPPGATQNRTRAGDEAGRGLHPQAARGAEHGRRARLQLLAARARTPALAFVTLKDWDEREGAEHSAQAVAGRAFGALMGIRDAFIFPLSPPPIPELGTASGFTFRLQDRGGNGHDALVAARNQLLGLAAQSKVLAGVRPDGLEDAPQLQLDIDRDKATALGVGFDAINADDLDRARLDLRQRLPERRPPAARGRAGRRAGAHAARRPAAAERAATAAASRCRCRRSRPRAGSPAPMQTIRYNGYPTMRIAGDAAPGYSTGDAMAEMERLAAQLPAGFGFEWTGQSREEKLAGSQALHAVRLRAAGGVPVPGRAVRELVDPARGDPGRAAGRARRAAGRPACAAMRTTSTSRSA